jgi:hypothetical protein
MAAERSDDLMRCPACGRLVASAEIERDGTCRDCYTERGTAFAHWNTEPFLPDDDDRRPPWWHDLFDRAVDTYIAFAAWVQDRRMTRRWRR